MNKLILITKILLKSGQNVFSLGSNKKENLKKIGLTIFLILCMLPLMIGITTLVIDIYESLKMLKMEGLLLGGVFSISSFIILIFGMFSVISIYYFSNDIENLIVLPVKPSKILQAKFITVMIQQYLIEAIFTLPVIIAFAYKGGAGILFWIYYVLIFLTLPVIPIVICSIVSMIIMSFTKFAKNKDAFKTIASVVGIFFAIGINVVMQKLPNGNSEQVKNLLESNKENLNMVTNIFPTSKFATKALIDNSSMNGFMNLGIFLIISILALVIFSYVGELLYLKGAIGIKQSTSKRKKIDSTQLEKTVIQSSSLKAYTLKEIKILFRTSAYFTQCVLSGIMMPVMMIILYMVKNENAITLPKGHDNLILIIGFGVLALATSINYVTATSISREGSNVYISKYIPVSYKIQINSKILSSFSVSIISFAIMMVMGVGILKIRPFLLLLIVIPGLIAMFALASIGMLIDLIRPKLKWDAEIKAVKQNMNTFLMMIVSFAMLGFICFGAIKLNLSLISTAGYLIGVSTIIGVIAYGLVITKGVKLFENIES